MLDNLRYKILYHSFKSKEGHIASCFSILEILFVLTRDYIKPKKANFILSKGHASLALYVVYNYFSIISNKVLESFSKFNSHLGGHPDSTKIKEFMFSTGSLGHGLPTSAGLALSYKIKKNKKKVFCLLGDQELLEGTTWETLFFIQNHNINNLIILIDQNNSDFRSTKLLNIRDKLKSFTNNLFSIDGHNLDKIKNSLKTAYSSNKFSIIIFKTVKGKGIARMENNPEWHHKFPDIHQLNEFKSILLNEK